MITTETITEMVKEKYIGTDIFLVEVSVSKQNQINIFIDSLKGVDISTCVQLSKHIESLLDREVEDYELNVSSAGIDRPLKVIKQYEKNIGQNVSVETKKGEKYKGKLLKADNDTFAVQYEAKEIIEGKKKKQIITKEIEFNYELIKETKILIDFK
ncbi:MAG: ribosome assembly cofactor RimP [Bacteroidales bacterium]|nr:ribosome assembly cofactor RimP [Bacteroidales bacterium]